MTSHNPATATLEEARHVVELIRKSLRYASGEDAADLSYELADWERVVRERSEASPPPPTLDVERLARAMEYAFGSPIGWRSDPSLDHDRAQRAYRANAEAIAREYAAATWGENE